METPPETVEGGTRGKLTVTCSFNTLTVDGIPCSALEGQVETPPETVEGSTGGKLSYLPVNGVPRLATDGSVVPPLKR